MVWSVFCVTCSMVLGWLIWVLRRCRRLLRVCPRRCPVCPRRPSTRTPVCAIRRPPPHSVASRPCVSPRRRPASPRSVLPVRCRRPLSLWRRAWPHRSSIRSIRERRRRAPSSPRRRRRNCRRRRSSLDSHQYHSSSSVAVCLLTELFAFPFPFVCTHQALLLLTNT